MSDTPSKSKLPLVLLALVVLAGAGAYAYWRAYGLPAVFASAPSGLTLQGNVEVRQVNLGFKVAGRIEKLYVDEGATVKAGDKLASLEKVYFQEALDQAKATRAAASANADKLQAGNRPEDIAQAEATLALNQAQLVNSTQDLDRAKKLLESNAGTQKTYDDAVAAERVARARVNVANQALNLMRAGFRIEDIAGAKAQLAQQDAVLKVAERSLADSDLIAPNDGVIESRAREVGAIVGIGEAVFVESLTKPVWVRTYVSEPDLPRLHQGMKVAVKSDDPAIPTMQGEVGFISTEAEFTPKTVETRELRTALVYRVRIVVADPADALRQGMPVSVEVAK